MKVNKKTKVVHLRELLGIKKITDWAAVEEAAVEAVRQRKIVPYFKQTMRMHDSGYRAFEIGYITLDMTKKAILAKHSDHVSWMENLLNRNRRVSFNMDIAAGGEIRIFRGFAWDSMVPLSSALLEYVSDGKDQ